MDEPKINKVMVAAVVIKFVAVLILLFALLQMAYVGERIMSENYDTETVDVVQAAFYLGLLIGLAAMMVIEAARSVVGVAVELCVDGLKWMRDHLTGEKRKQPTQPDWTDKAFGLNRIHEDEQDSRLR